MLRGAGIKGLTALDGATAWLNTQPLTATDLRGNVVVVNFWTYTCINWIRTLPHVRAWADRYRDQGLVLLGVHSPEFGFEHELGNVRRAVAGMRVGHPVAVDNDFRIWQAFDNRYWPALYFVDARGELRHTHFGENDYRQSEMVIRDLLTESGRQVPPRGPAAVDAAGLELPADWDNLASPETYLGYERAENFASPGGAVADTPHGYVAPARWAANDWALTGDWTIGPREARLNAPGGSILVRFHSRDVHLVLSSQPPSEPVRFRVLLDGQPPAAAAGLDVDVEGRGALTEPRLYQLVRRRGPVTDGTLEITFLDPGALAHVFTFG
jgi:thiol-disulfide isomerase/thioredoxin